MEQAKKNIKLNPDYFARANEAPELTGTLIRNRAQFLAEKYIQNFNVPLEKYIQNNQYLDLNIPIEVIRVWYPTSNWKKDLENMCSKLLSKQVRIRTENGNFRNYNIFSSAELTDEGLSMHIEPSALKVYLLDSDSRFTNVDYNVTTYFTCKYSHQLYWECVKNSNAFNRYRFVLTPEGLNLSFGLKYTPNKLALKILEPVRLEFETLYERGIMPLKFRYETIIKPKGRSRYIDHWQIYIESREREQFEGNHITGWIKEIEVFLDEYLPLKKPIIMAQVSQLQPEIIGKLYTRICKLKNGELKVKDNPTAYICQVLMSDDYQINPNRIPKRKKHIEKENQQSLPFDDGIDQWQEFLSMSKDYLQGEYYESKTGTQKAWDVWINTLEYVDYKDNELYVKCSRFVAEYIEENLIDKLFPLLIRCFNNKKIKLTYQLI